MRVCPTHLRLTLGVLTTMHLLLGTTLYYKDSRRLSPESVLLSLLFSRRWIKNRVPVRDIMVLFFFFQAEDGIRDHCVTGVQTCALPISPFFCLFAVSTNCRYAFVVLPPLEW